MAEYLWQETEQKTSASNTTPIWKGEVILRFWRLVGGGDVFWDALKALDPEYEIGEQIRKTEPTAKGKQNVWKHTIYDQVKT